MTEISLTKSKDLTLNFLTMSKHLDSHLLTCWGVNKIDNVQL